LISAIPAAGSNSFFKRAGLSVKTTSQVAGTNGPFALVYGRLTVADGLCGFPHKSPAMHAGRGLAVRSSRPKTFSSRSGSIHSAFRECDFLLAFAPQSIARELKARLLNRHDLVFAGIGRGGG
jgi:hypothetical protein